MRKLALLNRQIPRRALVWLCVAALLVTLLPLYALSFYNHACYDDFGFSIRTHQAWEDTGSMAATLRAALENTVAIRQTWEGTYATSFISALQPALGSEGLYWLTTALLLTFFLLSLGFFLYQVVMRLLGADRQTFLLAFCCLSFVMIQFVPDLSEAFFWFNGGVAYTLMWSVMVLRLGTWVCFAQAKGGWRKGLGAMALMLLTVVMGGAKYTTVLFAALADALIVGYGFLQKRGDRWARLAIFALLMAGFVFSMTAPGNAMRARTLLGGMSAPKAILQAFYFGIALMGHWFSLPLLVVWALVAWQLSEALRGCPQRFHHPVWITVLCVCLFCAQLAPTLYTGNYLGDGRTVNTYFYTFVLMSCALALYWTGWWIRRTERKSPFPAIGTAQKDGLRVAAFAVAVALLVAGCLSFRADGSETYGLDNTATGSALRSLLKGEAAAYDAAMDERDERLNDPQEPEVVLEPIEDVPQAFMGDALTGENLDYVLSLYETYYNKQRVSVAEEE